MGFHKLEEKVSDTVVEQFLQHCSHLKELKMFGMADYRWPEKDNPPSESDRLNILALVSKIIDGQDEPSLKKLSLNRLSSLEVDEPTDEDKHMIFAVVRSTVQLIHLDLSDNAVWF